MAFMRYVGQGHEIPVTLPARRLEPDDAAGIRAAYDAAYTRFYDRPVPGSDVEIMSYAVLVATEPTPMPPPRSQGSGGSAARRRAGRRCATR